MAVLSVRRALLVVLVAIGCSAQVVPPPPPGAGVAPHPRVVLTPARVAAVKAAVAANATGDAANSLHQLMEHAAWAKAQPPVPHGVPGPSGILMQVRYALDLLLTSAAAHVFRADAGDASYLQRAIAELTSLCDTWPDWNPIQHALDLGEASFAVGLAYDWLYNDLDAGTRAMVADGLVSRGLSQYEAHIPNRTTFWWVNNTINWNCVCSAGGVTATMALYGDVAHDFWTTVLQPLVSGVAPCVGAYHNDSSWIEGPGYWAYASKYNVWLFSGLLSVTGGAAGLPDLPGVALAGRFPLYSTGANILTGQGETYNWADAGLGQEWNPFASWWGLPPFSDGASSYYARLGGRVLAPASLHAFAWGGFVEALCFFDTDGEEADIVALPRAHFFDIANVALSRGPWDAPRENQTFLSAKGGDSGANHNHLDHGSFVYDYAGTRFAEDMGADNYNTLPDYFKLPGRWTYYRLNARGHNVLLVDNTSMVTPVVSPVSLFAAPEEPLAPGAFTVDAYWVVDLALAYAPWASSYSRGFASLNGAAVALIVDELTWAPDVAPANATWQLHTRATPARASPTSVTLSAPASPGGPAVALALLGAPPASLARWDFVDVAALLPSPPYDSAKGYTRVDAVLLAPAAAGGGRLRLAWALGAPELVAGLEGGAPAVRPLDEWAASGPLAR